MIIPSIIAALAVLFSEAAADPVAECDGVNQFVADDESLCKFYQCAAGRPIAMSCSKGTRLPTYYFRGNASPCSLRPPVQLCCRCNVTDDVIPQAKVSSQCEQFQPCRTRPGCTCINQVAGYYCSCPATTAAPAPTPSNDAVPLCKVNVCQNGGTCNQLYNNQFCNCPPPYTGKFCEVNACDIMICDNGACTWDRFSVFCQCERCFTGDCCNKVITSKPGCSGCNECIGGSNCTELRTHLCKCNPCSNPKESCRDGVFNKRPRSCYLPPTTASDSYTLMFQDNYSDPPFGLEVYVSAAEDDNVTRTVTVDTPLGTAGCQYSQKVDIAAGVVQKFQVGNCLKHLATGKQNVGIRVRETSGKLINVYCINRAQWSADGWLALPDKVAGLTFTVISYSPIISSSQFAIVATANKTVVKIVLSNPSEDLAGSAANGLLIVHLDAYQTYQVQSKKNDLSGTVIQSNNPIHVYSGESRTWVGPSAQNPDYPSTTVDGYSKSRDNLILECPGWVTWGNTYAIVPLSRTMLGYAYTEEAVRIAGTTTTVCVYYATTSASSAEVAFKAYTVVLQEDQRFVTQIYLNAEYNYFLSCSKPVEIVEITESALIKYSSVSGGNFADYNDPSFIYVPAVSSYTNFFHFVPPVFSVTGGPYKYTYMRLIAEQKDYPYIELNDQPLYPTPPAENEVAKPWSPIYVPAGAPASDYPRLYGAIFRISSSSETEVFHPDGSVKFMCIVEGFDDRESYAIVLGANIRALRNGTDAASASRLAALTGQQPFLTVY